MTEPEERCSHPQNKRKGERAFRYPWTAQLIERHEFDCAACLCLVQTDTPVGVVRLDGTIDER